MFKIKLKHLYFLYLQFMDIPLVTYITTKKRFGKKSNSPKLSTPIMSSSPKTIPTPRTYATVIAPTNVSTPELTKTPVMEYPPLPTHYITQQPIKQYELFPIKSAIPKEQQSFCENYYITQEPIKTYELFPMKAVVPKEQPFRENYYNIPPNPQYIQQMLYTDTYPQKNYPPPPPQNYPPTPPQNYPPPPPQNYPPPPPQNYPPSQYYMNLKILAMMHYHESFWNKFCKNDSVRVNVRESFKYFPH